MAQGVAAELDSNDASLAVKAALDEAVDSNLMYIDFETDLQPSARAAFRAALHQYRDRLIRSGPSALANPELFDGHVQRMQELSALVDQAVALA